MNFDGRLAGHGPSFNKRTLKLSSDLIGDFGFCNFQAIVARHSVSDVVAHVFYNMNYLALIITLVLAFVYLLLGGE